MKQALIILLLCGTLRAWCFNDSLSRMNLSRSMTFEALGSGGLYSFNYESSWRFSPRLQYRLGISVFMPDNRWQVTFPLMVQKLFGQKKHGLLLGFGQGITLAYYNYGRFASFVRGIINVGWQYQRSGKRTFIRLCYTPLVSYLVRLAI